MTLTGDGGGIIIGEEPGTGPGETIGTAIKARETGGGVMIAIGEVVGGIIAATIAVAPILTITITVITAIAITAEATGSNSRS